MTEERKSFVFSYHEFVANAHASITNALTLGQRENAKRIALQLYIFARSSMENPRIPKEELLKEVKELQKKDAEEVYIEASYALKDAGYSGIQELQRISFFRSIMKKSREG
jgi:hypothetical protein